MTLKIRTLKPTDINFIMDFWLRSYHNGMTGYRPTSKIFFSFHQKQIEKLHAADELVVMIACLPEDEDIIMGFAVFGIDYSLHYIGVKETYKNLGIAKKLLKSFYKDRSEITVTHWTKDIKHIQKIYKVNYNPYRFYQ